MKREEIFDYVKAEYGTAPEYLWASSPDSAVLRNYDTKKWYAIIMPVKRRTLNLPGEGIVDIMNVKNEPMTVDFLKKLDGFLPAYHMSKTSWISIVIDEVDSEEIKRLIKVSYGFSEKKGKQKK